MAIEHSVYTSDWRDWADQQLTDAGYSDASASATRYMIDKILDAASEIFASDEVITAATVTAVALLGSEALTEERWTPEKRAEDAAANAVWVPVSPGMSLTAGMTVRVKAGAYSDNTGRPHNGKVGKLVGIRRGMALLQYAGEPAGAAHHHALTLLDVRVG